MSNIKITIEGVEKEYRRIGLIETKTGDFKFENKWYREVEPVKQDYEIQSFKDDKGNISIRQDNGKYVFAVMYYPLNHMLLGLKDGTEVIHSVKRLTDGEVFTLKDREKDCGEIIEFIITPENKMWVVHLNNDSLSLNEAEKFIQPTILLTTEDGEEITDREQKIFWLDDKFNKEESYAKILGVWDFYKYFSTEAARDEYILQNKPVTVTLAEVTEYFKDRNDLLQPNIEDVKYFFKSKQNNTI